MARTGSRGYDPKAVEEKWQAVWEKADLFRVSEDRAEEEVLPPGDVPLPFGQDPHGPRQELLHRRRDRPLQADAGAQRPPPDGMGRLRHAGGKRGHPARRPSGRLDEREHRLHEEAVEAPRLRLRLGQGDRDLRRGVLPLGAMDLPQDV